MMPSETDVAVVVFDTMRADTFESHFSWLTDRSVSFENAWSTSHWTIPAHASLFTGLYASEVGTHSKNRTLLDTGTNLAAQLSEAGYTTRGLTANWTVAPEWDFDRGFDDYRYTLNQSDWKNFVDNDAHVVSRYPAFFIRALTAKDTTQVLWEGFREAISKTWFNRYFDSGARRIHATIQRLDFESPEFLFLNFMEVHSPYSPPAAYLSGKPASLHSFRDTASGPSDDPSVIRAAYNDAARYLSDQYREIHATLEEQFDIIITVSDHGEAFGEYGIWGHPPALNPEITRIPFVISGPMADEIEHADGAPVNLFDVYQTVLDVAGIDPHPKTRGVSLRNEVPKDRSCLVETHGLTPSWRGTLESDNVDAELVAEFDLINHAVATTSGYAFEQFGELNTVGSVDDPAIEINRLTNKLTVRDVEPDDRGPSDELQDHLEALGYA